MSMGICVHLSKKVFVKSTTDVGWEYCLGIDTAINLKVILSGCATARHWGSSTLNLSNHTLRMRCSQVRTAMGLPQTLL